MLVALVDGSELGLTSVEVSKFGLKKTLVTTVAAATIVIPVITSLVPASAAVPSSVGGTDFGTTNRRRSRRGITSKRATTIG